jgi:hypothetical protein
VCKLLLIGPVGATSASCAHVFWLISRCKDDVIKYLESFVARNRSPKVSLVFVVANFCYLAKTNLPKKNNVLSKSSFSSKQKKSKSKCFSFQYSFFFKNSKIYSFEYSFSSKKITKKLFSNNPSLLKKFKQV